MTWTAILLLGAASYAIKAVGPVLVGERAIPGPLRELLDLAAVPLLAAVIVTQTFATGTEYDIDARVPAIGLALVLVWRRAPFLVVVLAAAATAAILRAL